MGSLGHKESLAVTFGDVATWELEVTIIKREMGKSEVLLQSGLCTHHLLDLSHLGLHC